VKSNILLCIVVGAVVLLTACDDNRSKAEAPVPPEQPRTVQAATQASPSSTRKAPCEQRFVPVGMVLSKSALDTKTGQQCRTADSAPPAFRSFPLCVDLLRDFPD